MRSYSGTPGTPGSARTLGAGGTQPSRRGDDRGSGTVLALALIAVVLVLAAAIGLLAGAQADRAQAQAAADLAALAGASRLVQAAMVGPSPGLAEPVAGDGRSASASGACSVAAEAARRNGARLTGCEVEPGHVLRVGTSRRSAAGTASAVARAGPISARTAGP